jgi:hypothetical protein
LPASALQQRRSPVAASHVAVKYGLADLDGAGEWLNTDVGPVWKPKIAEGWAPFQKGRWRWYDTLGYTWVSDETWGWVPYHYGRWTRKNDLGWVWAPPAKPVFKPGDVYWLYGRQLAGWGPLAPGEDWQPSAAPQQFLNVNTTYASLATDARVIDPVGFSARPKEPLGVATFALALPSPAFLASRLEAVRPALRVGATKPIVPVVPGTGFQDADLTQAPPPPPPQQMPPAVVTNPADDGPPVVQPGPVDSGPPGPPMQVIYPVPVYTGIVVINPPDHPDYSRRNPNNGNNGGGNNRNSGNNGTPQAPNPAPTNNPPPSGRQHPQPTTTGGPPPPTARPSPPTIASPPQRIDPPRIETGPSRADRPRVENLPPREGPRDHPRERPTPAPKVESKPPEVKADVKPDPKPDVKPTTAPEIKSVPGRKQ